MKILTDNKWKIFKYRDEVPESILKNEFDYIDENEIDGFIKYKNNWYHIGDFMIYDGDEFDGYINDTAFSGIGIKLNNEGEYKIFSFYS